MLQICNYTHPFKALEWYQNVHSLVFYWLMRLPGLFNIRRWGHHSLVHSGETLVVQGHCVPAAALILLWTVLPVASLGPSQSEAGGYQKTKSALPSSTLACSACRLFQTAPLPAPPNAPGEPSCDYWHLAQSPPPMPTSLFLAQQTMKESLEKEHTG